MADSIFWSIVVICVTTLMYQDCERGDRWTTICRMQPDSTIRASGGCDWKARNTGGNMAEK